jgi:hypothetical protein
LNGFGPSSAFPHAPSAEGEGEAPETNSKPSDWTESETHRSIWENEAERGLDDRIPASPERPGDIPHPFSSLDHAIRARTNASISFGSPQDAT